MKRIGALLLAAMLLLAGCAKNAESTPDSATADTATVDEATQAPTQAPTLPPTEPPSIDELAQKEFDRILNGSYADYAQLEDVEALNQMNGMQAGCEALALTAALNHFGYDLDIDDIVDDYLVYDNNFVIGYCGDPHRFYNGSGIYPPGMVTTTWNFIDDNDAELYPFDTTGLTMNELYRFVDAGCPVLIWTTYDRNSPRIEQYKEYDDIDYPWYDTEHCVCLFGYDLEDNEVKIADSWGGVEKWEDADRFEKVYDEVGQFSMVLMDTSKLK